MLLAHIISGLKAAGRSAVPAAFLLFCVCLGLSFDCEAKSPIQKDGELLRMAVLSRHGVRSPTQEMSTLQNWSSKVWPQWPVGRGRLTQRGALLTAAMWRELAKHLQDAGFAPNEKQISVRADAEQRTMATARAILDGLGFPQLPLPAPAMENVLLFHPVKYGLCRLNAEETKNRILLETDGGHEQLAAKQHAPVELISNIVSPLSEKLCREWGLVYPCCLVDLPDRIDVNPEKVDLPGSLGIASSLAEIFLMEYAQWPRRPAAWGKADAAVIAEILPLHNRVFDLVNRTRAVAAPNGSALLWAIAAELLKEQSVPNREPRLTIFAGHDTNIANVAGLLDLNWHLPGYGKNAIPPAAALIFELRQKENRRI
ncbi:MAG: histidine-type phosphatase, partial [Desulfovibrionaceae bacterium]|nr:histidine-type phosphatase [Desulfovibrionaceae bacterium]